MALTKRQFEVLALLDAFIRESGYCPSFEELGRRLQLSSVATVHKHLSTLERKGFIRRGHNQSRSIEVVDRSPLNGSSLAMSSKNTAPAPKETASSPQPEQRIDVHLPLLGLIAAGKPLEAVPDNESLSLKDFVGNKNVYVLRVKGDSMVEDHICDGDFVVVESTSTAENGDTVVALIDGHEATLKRFYREKNQLVRLQPANVAMTPIVVKESDLKIQGRVIGVLRKY